MIADLKNFKNMRRLIYDMFYADEISEDVAYKLIDKLNKVRDKTKYSWERWKIYLKNVDVYHIEDM